MVQSKKFKEFSDIVPPIIKNVAPSICDTEDDNGQPLQVGQIWINTDEFETPYILSHFSNMRHAQWIKINKDH